MLELAEEEERNYKYLKAINTLKKAEKISADNSLDELRGEIYYRLGEKHGINNFIYSTLEEIQKNFKTSISYFEKALKLFEVQKNEEKIYATRGLINFFKVFLVSKEEKDDLLLLSAIEQFKKAKKLAHKKGNEINEFIMAIHEIQAMGQYDNLKIRCLDHKVNLTKLLLECKEKVSKLYEKIHLIKEIPERYIICIFDSQFDINFTSYASAEIINMNKFMTDRIFDYKKMLDILKNSPYRLALYLTYLIYASMKMTYSMWFMQTTADLIKNIKISQNLLETGLKYKPKIKIISFDVAFLFAKFCNEMVLMAAGLLSKQLNEIEVGVKELIEYTFLLSPKSWKRSSLINIVGIFSIGLGRPFIPNPIRLDSAKRSLKIIESMKNEFGEEFDYGIYKEHEIHLNTFICLAYAAYAEAIEDLDEKNKHLEIAKVYFNKVSDYKNIPAINEIITTNFFINVYAWCLTKAGMFLGKNASKISDKIRYYEITLELLLQLKKTMNILFPGWDSLFFIGDVYFELGRLNEDEKYFKNAYSHYTEIIEFFKDKQVDNMIGAAYVNLAKIDDRFCNYHTAAENYQNAIDAFEKSLEILQLTDMREYIDRLIKYLKAWKIIEQAKALHVNENHQKALIQYENASNILEKLREYRYEATFYSAWATLEKSEGLSKESKHIEAAEEYKAAVNDFDKAIEVFNSSLRKVQVMETRDRITNLIKVAKIRKVYCTARKNIETARLKSKAGNHLLAAELYQKSSSLFENLCHAFKIDKEKVELTAEYYLCKAWEYMERAEMEQKSILFNNASDLFKKAADLYPDNRLKRLTMGNSLYCSALEYGCRFDHSTDFEEKLNLYKKIKMSLRNSSKNYQIGGFEQDAKWALAMSIYFDGIWQFHQSDIEIDALKKNHYLNLAHQYLNNALESFMMAGYDQKKKEIENTLEMIKNEKKIIVTALNIIEKPAISQSSVGIIAPSCPLEISSSLNVEELQQHDIEAQAESKWREKILNLYLFTNDEYTCIHKFPFHSTEKNESYIIKKDPTKIITIIQDLLKKEPKTKIIEEENTTILLEHGKYLTGAILCEQNLMTLNNKLKQYIQEVENYYKDELKNRVGELIILPKIQQYTQKIFEDKGITAFISYATADSEMYQISTIADKLSKYPEIKIALHWEKDMEDDIYEYMDERLGESEVCILFCSPSALNSEAVKMEWRAALKKNKKIIPVFKDPENIPTLISTKLGVPYSEDDINRTIAEIHQLIIKKLKIDNNF